MTATTDFWFDHQVGGPYHDAVESFAALRDRAQLYPTLHRLMPTNHANKRCLDYGCGPGHDTILMLLAGATEVVYADVSPLALETTGDRVHMHGMDDHATSLTVPAMEPDGLFDHVHCAGVLHHVDDPLAVLQTIRRCLHKTGDVSLMVYDGGTSTHTQSKVPITHWFNRDDITWLAAQAGLYCIRIGRYLCESDWRPNCFAACYAMGHQ